MGMDNHIKGCDLWATHGIQEPSWGREPQFSRAHGSHPGNGEACWRAGRCRAIPPVAGRIAGGGGGVPFRGRNHALPGCGCGYRPKGEDADFSMWRTHSQHHINKGRAKFSVTHHGVIMFCCLVRNIFLKNASTIGLGHMIQWLGSCSHSW